MGLPLCILFYPVHHAQPLYTVQSAGALALDITVHPLLLELNGERDCQSPSCGYADGRRYVVMRHEGVKGRDWGCQVQSGIPTQFAYRHGR